MPHRHRHTARATSTQGDPLPPGSLGLPLVGETLSVAADGDGFGVKRVERYGPVYKTNILGSNTVMVYEEEDVTRVLTADTARVEVGLGVGCCYRETGTQQGALAAAPITTTIPSNVASITLHP